MYKITKRNIAYENFIKDLVVSIDKYGEDHIDVIIDNKENVVYLTYHSKNNSFNVSKDYTFEELEDINVVKVADDYNIGWSEI